MAVSSATWQHCWDIHLVWSWCTECTLYSRHTLSRLRLRLLVVFSSGSGFSVFFFQVAPAPAHFLGLKSRAREREPVNFWRIRLLFFSKWAPAPAPATSPALSPRNSKTASAKFQPLIPLKLILMTYKPSRKKTTCPHVFTTCVASII